MKKQDFTVIELIHNESFQRIIDGSASSEEREFWNNWMEASESNRRKVQEAISEITGFKFVNSEQSDLETEWAKLHSKTLGAKNNHKVKSIHKDSKLRWVFRIAAAILLITTVGVGVYLYDEEPSQISELSQITKQETISTEAGEQKTLKFTNGSKVAKIVMNSNSTVTYDVGLLKNQTIKVVLQGEAFFDVEEGFSETAAFSVRTPDGVIEDIGTEFLVAVSHSESRVILQEGMVDVKALQGQSRFQLGKGEMIEFDGKEILTKSKVNSTFYTSWATGYVEFDQTELKKVANFIEGRFGATVKFVDPQLANVTIDGAAYFRSLEELTRSVSDVMEIPVFQSASRDTIFIGRKYGG